MWALIAIDTSKLTKASAETYPRQMHHLLLFAKSDIYKKLKDDEGFEDERRRDAKHV